MNPAAEGNTYGPISFVLDPQRLRTFRDLFHGPEGVPPTFLAAAEFALFPEIVGDPELGLDFDRVVHGSQDYEFLRPLRVGEELQVHARISAIRHKGETGFLSLEMTMSGADGSTAAVTRSTMIERGADP